MTRDKLRELVQLKTLSVPKTVQIPHMDFVDNVKETEATWEIGVTHRLFPGATSFDIARLESVLRQSFPEQLVKLLSVTNGAELFCITMTFSSSPTGEKAVNPRYVILSTMAIAERYEEILEGANEFEEIQDYFEHHDGRMSYVPFCLLRDGNYLAFHMQKETLFFLQRDYNYFPFEIETAQDDYVHVADSIEEWLDKLIETHGFAGMGGASLEKLVA